MQIQFNTDKTIKGDERKEDYFVDLISKELEKYSSDITRIEVHLSDENGKKEGLNDIRCLLEARLEGKQPIAVINQADKIEYAVSGAISKLKASLKTIVERSSNH
jgi:ribosome-associated translation inhibitor RaiA